MIRKEKLIPLHFAFILLFSLISSSTWCQLTQGQIDSLITELGQAKEDTNKVNLLMTLGNETGYTDLRKALQYGRDGYALSTKINYIKGMGRTSYLIGNTYLEMGDYVLSDSFTAIAEKHFNQLNDKRNLAIIANSRGSRNYMVGNYVLAADYFAKAAAGFDEIKDTSLSMIAYQNLVAVVAEVKNYEKAVALSKKILPVAEARKDSLQIGYTLQGLVTNLIYQEKYEEAAGYLEQLTNIANNTPDQNLAAEAHSTVGTYYYRNNNFDQAANYFKIAIQKAETLGNKYQLANHYNSLGQAYYRMRNFPLAKSTLLTGLSHATEHTNKRAESNIALSLSTLYDSIHEYSNAFNNLLLHTQITDSILNSETRNYTTQLETLYQTNKKENEILRLQQVEQQKDFALRKRNIYLGIAGGLLLIAIIILSLIRKNFSNKQKLAKQQSVLQEERIISMEKQQQVISLQSMINGQETERTRIAKDLHDGLGGIFSTVKMHYSILQQDTPEIKNNPLYKKTMELINNATDELRKVAHNMMPEVLMKVGLAEALQDFANNISSGKLLNVTLQTYGMEKRLNSSTEIMLYRIIQELVNNIIKHAYATEAIIQINREGNRLSLTIEDNGRGFDTREAEDKKTMGMATVKSRVDYLNGKLTIDSRKDIGTTVMIDLLINE